MLNLERLRALHAVATHGSVNAAAAVLHVTTSAVSQQLAKLEDEVGQPLLERRGRGVRLTDAATLLVGHAERALSALERAEADLDAQRRSVVGQLSIAAFPTACRGLAVEALRRLNRLHPRLQVTLSEEGPVPALPRLSRGDLDLVLAKDWSNSPLAVPEGLSRVALLDDVADVALHAEHPLARRRSVTLSELAGDRWITSEHGSFCHDWLKHTLRTRGRDPVVTHTAGEYSTQLALVAAGFGAAIIPRLGRETVPPDVHMVPITPTLVRHIYAVWRTDATRRTAIQAAVEALHFAARRLVKGRAAATGRPAARRSRSTASPRSSSSGRRGAPGKRSTPAAPSSG